MNKDKFNQFMMILTKESFTPAQWEQVRACKVRVEDTPIQGKKVSKEMVWGIETLISRGMSPTEIAKELNVSRTTVYRHIEKMKKQGELKL